MLRTSSSTDLSSSAAQVVVKYDKVDDVRWCWRQVGRRIVKKSKNRQKARKTSKAWKSCAGHRFGGTFTLRRFIDRASTVFQALFAGPRRSSLDTNFESIIDKAKLMELLMLCHVFPISQKRKIFEPRPSPAMTNNPSAPSIFLQSARFSSATSALECTPGTSASKRLENLLRMSSLCYFNSGDALWKKMSQPRIDGLGGCWESCASPSIEKTQELVARKS